jgi:hypothetical protein
MIESFVKSVSGYNERSLFMHFARFARVDLWETHLPDQGVSLHISYARWAGYGVRVATFV